MTEWGHESTQPLEVNGNGRRVSVVVPCRDAARTLPLTLASIERQTHRPLQVVLVNNASRDSTGEIIERWRPRDIDVTRLSEPEPGPNRARATGYAAAGGAFVQWLDADDLLAPDKIAAQVGALEARPEADIAYGDWIWRHVTHRVDRGDGGRGLAVPFVPALAYGDRRWRAVHAPRPMIELPVVVGQHRDWLRRLLEDKWLPPHAYLLRREAAQRLYCEHAFWPDRPIAQDREYFTLAALWGMRFLYAPGSVAVYMRWSTTQATAHTTVRTRIDALRAIFLRLRAEARRVARPLDAAHTHLLAQRWAAWTPVRERLQELARRADASGETARVVSSLRQPNSLEMYAKHLQHQVPALWEQHLEALHRLEALVDMGALVAQERDDG